MASSSSEAPSSFDPSKFYEPDTQSVEDPARTVLEKYSRIPDESIVDHVNEVVRLTIHNFRGYILCIFLRC